MPRGAIDSLEIIDLSDLGDNIIGNPDVKTPEALVETTIRNPSRTPRNWVPTLRVIY